MPRKSSEKNNSQDIKFSISPISVVNNSRLKPYIESFSYSPSNIIQQPLGNVLGFFKISDTSEDSAYIVNFLASVLKKEYYINPRRSVEESFDLALHKVNIALSEIAKNGNINWLGMLDAAICVIEKNHFHFSVAGNANILLLRDNVLSDISEDLAASDEEPYPIKTFVNVSSGALKPGDKIIITSNDIFRVFSLTEIRKNASRFSREKFVQLLHTALINELEIAETIIIDVFEPEKTKTIKQKKEAVELSNVFSEKAFREAVFSQPPPVRPAPDKEEKVADFTDEKTGHIYIQEGKAMTGRRSHIGLYWFIFKENLSEIFYWSKEKTRKLFYLIKQKAKSIPSKDLGIKGAARKVKSKISLRQKINLSKIKKISISGKFSGVMPSFSKVKNIFANLNYQQRIYGLIILAFIIMLPLIFVRLNNKKQTPPIAQEMAQPKGPEEILANDKNINLSSRAEIIFSREKIVDIQVINNTLLLIAPQKLIQREGSEIKEFPLPQNSGNVLLSSPMEDLNLLFLLTDQKKLLSFSPVSGEFKQSNISIPDNAGIQSMATYLTYIYLIDGNNNQIYRYPRAEGGFGQRINWLKEEISLNNISDIAIDENIYLVEGDNLIKLFRGKKQDLPLEQSNTPINFNKIRTDIAKDQLYIIDSFNSRLVILGKNGEIRSQYYHELLKNALDFAVDSRGNKIYFVTSDSEVAALDL